MNAMKKLQNKVFELIVWKNENKAAPRAVIEAIEEYREKLISQIKSLQPPPFHVGEEVVLNTDSYEDDNLPYGCEGIVKYVTGDHCDAIGNVDYDVRVYFPEFDHETSISASSLK